MPAGVGLGVCALESLLLRVALSGSGAANKHIAAEKVATTAAAEKPVAEFIVDARSALFDISLMWLLLFTGFFLRSDQAWPTRAVVLLLICRAALLR